MKGFILTIVLVIFVSASLPAALPREGDAPLFSPIVRPVKTKAVISGLEHRVLRSLPPVLVELSDLPGSAAVWVEVLRGHPGDGPLTGRAVNTKFYLREGGTGVLSVPGIHKACRSGGTYNLLVKKANTRGTITLAQQTFDLFPLQVVRH